MTTQKKELHQIDQNLYRFNIMCQLRLIESNRARLYKESEKQVLQTLLKNCKDVNGNKLRSILDKIFNRSVQSVPSKATVKIDNISNTKATKEAAYLPTKATTPTLEAPNTSNVKNVAQDGDTDTNPKQNIATKENETYTSIIERQLYDPKMSKVSVKIKQRHRGPKCKAASSDKASTEKKYSSIKKRVSRKSQVKRRKPNKRSYK
ncbi:unnamed protein product [Mucor fragilis]